MEGLLQNPRRLPPTGKEQEGSAQPFLSPDLSYKEASQDLTPNCSEVRNDLICSKSPSLCPTSGLAQREARATSSGPVTGQSFFGPFFVPC